MIHKIIGHLELLQKVGEVVFQVSKFSIINSSPNQILVTSQTMHSEIIGSPSALHPFVQKKVVTTLYLILGTGKITIGICEALEVLQ